MVFCHPVREVKKSPFFSVISETIQNQSRSPNAYFLRTKKVYFGLRPSVKFISERKNQGNLFSGEKTIRGGRGEWQKTTLFHFFVHSFFPWRKCKMSDCQSVFSSDVAFAHIFGHPVVDQSGKRFCMRWGCFRRGG